jgi:hypothetical protein
MRTLELIRDANGVPIQNCIPLCDHQEVDGSSASAICTNPIDGRMVRIKSYSGALRIAIGPSTEASPLTAIATDLPIGANDEIYQPCNVGDYVAVLGGAATISTCGR